MRDLMICALALATALAGCAKSHTRGDEGGVPRGGGPATCTPGAAVSIGCAAGCGIGSCTGDPVLAVCEGSVPLASCLDGPSSIAQVDDTSCGGLCPEVSIRCPSSGRIVVAHRAYMGRSGRPYTCDWQAR